MNKKVIFLIVISIIILPFSVKAGNTYVINSKATPKTCSIRTKPNEGGNYVIPNVLHWLDPGDVITLVDGVNKEKSTNTKCKSDYYYVNYEGTKGYICGDYINFENDGKYNEEFKNAGFPESYWLSLNVLKTNHPKWKFIAYNTNLDWEQAISAESAVEKNSSNGKYWSRSYISSTNSLYKSKAEGAYNTSNGTYNMLEAGGWYAASKGIVAHYMDPRNFLNDSNIFMFESGEFITNRQTKKAITKLFENTAHSPYVNDFYDAATAGGNNINPMMIGARSRLEVGGTKELSNAANGSKGYYNFYNIGALSSCTNPVACGNNYASGKGWTTPRTAIIGGASFIYTSYVQKGQNTIYFQKFNTTNNGNIYAHQYMTNIEAPKNEAYLMYLGYVNSNTLNEEATFIIPVYKNMPSTAVGKPTTEEKAPTPSTSSGSSSTQTVDIPSVISKAGYSISGGYIKRISNGISTSKFSSNLKAKGNVNISISNKAISTTQNLATGDRITITSGNKSATYQVVVNGDTNGDGKISASDYVKIKNHIMGTSLSGAYKEASDVNGDGKTSASDYVRIKNYIMGSGSL